MRRRSVAVQPWRVAEPDYAALCALCTHPVVLFVPAEPPRFLETCSMCGIVIVQLYAGPEEDVCAACRPRYMAGEGR